MITLITLHGKIEGSARLKASKSGTTIELKPRYDAKSGFENGGALTAYLVSDSQIEAAPLAANRAEAGITGVKAVIIADAAGELIGTGSNGMPAEALERAKTRIRILLPKTADAITSNINEKTDANNGLKAMSRSKDALKAKQSGASGSEQTANAKANKGERHKSLKNTIKENAGADKGRSEPSRTIVPNSEAAKNILNMASELFSAGTNDSQMPKQAKSAHSFSDEPAPDAFDGLEVLCENCARGDEAAIKNPFPALFKNSSWRVRRGSEIIYGTAKINGKMYNITAIPGGGRFPPANLGGYRRRARSAGGKLYWLGISVKNDTDRS